MIAPQLLGVMYSNRLRPFGVAGVHEAAIGVVVKSSAAKIGRAHV